MKKTIVYRTILSSVLIVSFILGVNPSKNSNVNIASASTLKTWEKLNEEVNLRFAVFSDVHVGPGKTNESKRLKNIFSTVYKLDPKLKAISIVGDLTDTGADNEYDIFKSIIEDNKKLETELIATMGNHEGNTREKFTEVTGRNPRENRVINGYHFITLSPRSDEETYGGNRYNLDERWLREELNNAVKEDSRKPIFLFLHHGIKDTAYGTEEWNTPDLKNILKDYPQVIQFAGHSHFPLNDPRSIYQEDFTSINTSTISYFELESGMMYGTKPPKANNACQILILDVNDTEVRVKKLDLLSGKYIGSDWTIDTALGKEGFKYTNSREEESPAPYFKEGSLMKIDKINKTGCTITIDNAMVINSNSGEMVHSYKFDFINSTTGDIDKSYKIYSDFYLLPMSKKIIQSFTELNPCTDYKVVVTALNSYKKESINKLTATFKTA